LKSRDMTPVARLFVDHLKQFARSMGGRRAPARV